MARGRTVSILLYRVPSGLTPTKGGRFYYKKERECVERREKREERREKREERREKRGAVPPPFVL